VRLWSTAPTRFRGEERVGWGSGGGAEEGVGWGERRRKRNVKESHYIYYLDKKYKMLCS